MLVESFFLFKKFWNRICGSMRGLMKYWNEISDEGFENFIAHSRAIINTVKLVEDRFSEITNSYLSFANGHLARYVFIQSRLALNQKLGSVFAGRHRLPGGTSNFRFMQIRQEFPSRFSILIHLLNAFVDRFARMIEVIHSRLENPLISSLSSSSSFQIKKKKKKVFFLNRIGYK